jgi:hypothetical protein
MVSVINSLWTGQPKSCGLIHVTSRLAVRYTQHPIQWDWGGYGSLSAVVKQLEYKADCSLRSSSEVKIECGSTSVPPSVMVCPVNMYFIFYHGGYCSGCFLSSDKDSFMMT